MPVVILSWQQDIICEDLGKHFLFCSPKRSTLSASRMKNNYEGLAQEILHQERLWRATRIMKTFSFNWSTLDRSKRRWSDNIFIAAEGRTDVINLWQMFVR
jgi:hypothetical protein